MKLLLGQIIAISTLLIPATLLAEPAANKFGLAPGTEFSLIVKNREIITTDAFGKVTKPKTVPSGAPSLNKGAKVKFVVGKKGELTVPKTKGFVIKFLSASAGSIQYANIPTAKNPRSALGYVFQDGTTSQVTEATASFSTFNINGTKSTASVISYVFEK